MDEERVIYTFVLPQRLDRKLRFNLYGVILQMPLLLPSILANAQRPHQPFLLLQSSTAQSCVPVLRKIVNHKSGSKRVHTLLVCFLYPPSYLYTGEAGAIDVLDYTDSVPGYADAWVDPREAILDAVKAGESASTIPPPMCAHPSSSSCGTAEPHRGLCGHPHVRPGVYIADL